MNLGQSEVLNNLAKSQRTLSVYAENESSKEVKARQIA